MNHSWKIFVISGGSVSAGQQVLRQLLPLGLPFEIEDAVDAQQVKTECLVHRDDPAGMSTGAFPPGVQLKVVGTEERVHVERWLAWTFCPSLRQNVGCT
jgi:hypothetical protein